MDQHPRQSTVVVVAAVVAAVVASAVVKAAAALPAAGSVELFGSTANSWAPGHLPEVNVVESKTCLVRQLKAGAAVIRYQVVPGVHLTVVHIAPADHLQLRQVEKLSREPVGIDD